PRRRPEPRAPRPTVLPRRRHHRSRRNRRDHHLRLRRTRTRRARAVRAPGPPRRARARPHLAPARATDRTPRPPLVLVVRADPVICGHSGEARNLAEVALTRGFDEVRILTWPIERLQASGLPLKPLETVLPYSPGITVERPGPVGDYRVPDGRYLAGLTGRLVELFTDGAATVAMSLYLSPHTLAVTDAVQVARAAGSPGQVITIAEAVGSDVTTVVRSCLETGRYGAAAHLLASYLGNDVCVAVSAYTRELILTEAADLDAHIGTSFAPR